MAGIKITYSWGDEEEVIKCKAEDAWETMLGLAMEETRVDTTENENDVVVYFNRSICEIKLHYLSDDEYYYYRYVEDEEEN